MTSLSDHTDRLLHVAKSIKSTTASINVLGNAGVAGPFTTAVLYTHLGDLIRDIDRSELGLFNLVQPSDPGAHHARDRDNGKAQIPEITRVEFPGATPLKKPLGKKEDTQKRKELEPELYAQAALKYMDRYESIRPMPRAHAQVESIIEQLAAVRENMRKLGDSLEQTRVADVPQSPKDLANQEERRIHYIQTKLLDLNNRKEAALQRGKGALGRAPCPKPASSRQHPKPKTPRTSSKTDIREETFWTTPAPAARALHFDSLLSDEVVDLGNVSMSFASPLPAPRNTQSLPVYPIHNITEGADNLQNIPEEPPAGLVENFQDLNPEDNIVDEDGREEMEESEDEKTVVLKKISFPSPPLKPPSPHLLPTAAADAESPPGQQSARTPSGTGQKPRVRVTNEVERIVTKIWATIGEIIMPGHPFDVSGSGSAGTKPPRAKETIAHLHTISTQTPIPTSPTSSSLSSHSTTPQNPGHATPQQILTAYLIISLLSVPPHFSMPLQKVKEVLAEKAQGSLGAGRTTSVLYGCVAKRLVRIDRGGGEQVVKFDVI